MEHFELWDFVLKDFPKRAVLEFVSRADPLKQAEIEQRLHGTLARTLEAFPGPALTIGGNPFESSSGSPSRNTNSNLNNTTTSLPEPDEWTGDEREVEPWLGWFKPPGAITRPPPHMAHKGAP